MKNFKWEKDYWDNGYKSWDGIYCPKCEKVFDPDNLIEKNGKPVCPSCFFRGTYPINN